MPALAVTLNLHAAIGAAADMFGRHPSIMFLLASVLLFSAASFFEKLGQKTSAHTINPPMSMKNMDESSYEI